MAFDITPSSFWNFPSFRMPSVFTEDEDDLVSVSAPSGISISEDDKKVYITAALPGVNEKDIDITFNKGMLWVKGESATEEKDKARKFYRRATGSFSYRVAVPGDVDLTKEPEATYQNGVMTVSFDKSPVSQPKKITVKSKK